MDAMAGIGLVGILIVGVVSILPWIALMCIWSNTSRTARFTEKCWHELKGRGDG